MRGIRLTQFNVGDTVKDNIDGDVQFEDYSIIGYDDADLKKYNWRAI